MGGCNNGKVDHKNAPAYLSKMLFKLDIST